MVVIFDATVDCLRKAHSARKLDKLIRDRIAKGEFYAVRKSEFDGMEEEETDSSVKQHFMKEIIRAS